MMTEEIYTDRLILKPFDLRFAPVIQEKFNRWEIIQHIGGTVPWPYPDDGAITFMQRTEKDNQKGDAEQRYIHLKESDTFIGSVDIRFPVAKERQFETNEVGYWLDQNHWGKGYMTEAVRAFLKHMISKHKLDRISSRAAVNNQASQSVLKKVGFKQVGEGDNKYHSGCQREYHYLLTKDDEGWKKLMN